MGWHPGPAAGHEGYRQVGGGDRADRSARLPAPAPGSPPGRRQRLWCCPACWRRT